MSNMKIEETIKLKNIILKCVESKDKKSCNGCYFNDFEIAICDGIIGDIVGSCYDYEREDKTPVIFTKVEEE